MMPPAAQQARAQLQTNGIYLMFLACFKVTHGKCTPHGPFGDWVDTSRNHTSTDTAFCTSRRS